MIGERIKYFRKLWGMTQRQVGRAIGFNERTADIRMAQYESGTRTPKENVVADIANVLKVSPQALTVPDIDTQIGLAHTLFTLEDRYGLKISRIDGTLCLTLAAHKEKPMMLELFDAWHKQADKLNNNEITEDDYNAWRYTYPKGEIERFKAAVDEMRTKKKN